MPKNIVLIQAELDLALAIVDLPVKPLIILNEGARLHINNPNPYFKGASIRSLNSTETIDKARAEDTEYNIGSGVFYIDNLPEGANVIIKSGASLVVSGIEIEQYSRDSFTIGDHPMGFLKDGVICVEPKGEGEGAEFHAFSSNGTWLYGINSGDTAHFMSHIFDYDDAEENYDDAEENDGEYSGSDNESDVDLAGVNEEA